MQSVVLSNSDQCWTVLARQVFDPSVHCLLFHLSAVLAELCIPQECEIQGLPSWSFQAPFRLEILLLCRAGGTSLSFPICGSNARRGLVMRWTSHKERVQISLELFRPRSFGDSNLLLAVSA